MTIAPLTNRWVGQWIWDNEPIGDSLRQVIAARTTFDLDHVPDFVGGRVFADALYVLYVNGHEICRGPGRANPHSRRYDTFDLASALHVGTNVVTIVAAISSSPSRNWMPGPTRISELSGGALVFEADMSSYVLATDPTWMTTTIAGWGLTPDTGMISRRGLELIDVGEVPSDLHDVVVEKSRWRPARVKSGRGMGDFESTTPPSYPFGPMQATSLRPPIPTTRRLQFDEHTGAWMLPDIGAGTLMFDIEGSGGELVKVLTFETVEANGSIRPFHEPIGVQLTAATNRRQVETLDHFGLRGLAVDAPASVTIHGVSLVERIYPLVGSARFSCSDPFFDQVYAAGRRTVSLCSLDAYVDTPTREGRAWTGDSVVHQMVDFVTNEDWSLARWNAKMASLSTMSDGMVPASLAGDAESIAFGVIPDWALHWVHSVWNVYRYAGDEIEVADMLPEVERVVRWFDRFFLDATDLPTDVTGWCLVDWAWVPTNGASAVVASLLGRACLDFAEMAEFVGDHGRAERARRRHERLVVGFEKLWDPVLERYADTLVKGVRGETASVHTQAAAIVGGLAPTTRIDRLVSLITDRSRHVHATLSEPEEDPGMDGAVLLPGAQMMMSEYPEPWFDAEQQLVMTQPFFRYVVHDALAAVGRSDLILDSMLDWKHLLDRCPTSLAETFWAGSLAHGWSATPTRDLITRIVGVTPAEPGCGVVSISPSLGHLEWVEAVVPTPAGNLTVRVDRLVIEFDSPVPAVVEGRHLPAGVHRVERRA
jgi:alpha-L-rhamnosidase